MKRLRAWWAEHRPLKTDKMIWFILINSVAWVWCSYLFAYLGISDTVTEVSRYVVTEVIAVFAVAAMKNFGENLSKHNTWPDKTGDDTKKDAN